MGPNKMFLQLEGDGGNQHSSNGSSPPSLGYGYMTARGVGEAVDQKREAQVNVRIIAEPEEMEMMEH